jgi:autotransporter family porin
MLRRLILLAPVAASLPLIGAVPANATYAAHVSDTPGLAGYWRLGETFGRTAFDHSRRGHNGTYLNRPRLGRDPGPTGTTDGSVGFDGVDDAVTFGDAYGRAGAASFSIEAWIRPRRARRGAARRIVIGKESRSGAGGYSLVLAAGPGIGRRGGRLTFRRRSRRGTDSVRGATPLAPHAWYHVVVSYDGRTMRLYVNGTLDGSRRSRRALPDTRAPLRLGSTSRRSAFRGLIDDVAFYLRALHPDAVREHYEAGVAAAAPPAPSPRPAPAAPPTTTAWSRAELRPPGSDVLSDAMDATRVRRSAWEPRPGNTSANHRVPTAAELATFRSESAGQSPLFAYVTGNFTGTTDEIIQWAAHKWGYDEDVMRALAVQETGWDQAAVGDGGISFGITQVKSTVWRGTAPLSRLSTAFNLDVHGAIFRHCFDGYETWMTPKGYAAGDVWGCIGWIFSGDWYDPAAIAYRDSVQAHLTARTWEQPDFALAGS